jgi:hypothetical protein
MPRLYHGRGVGLGVESGPSRHPASPKRGPRAGIRGGGDVASPRCARIWRTAGASVMKAMMRISVPHRDQ